MLAEARHVCEPVQNASYYTAAGTINTFVAASL